MGKKVKLTVKEIEAMTAGVTLWDTDIRGFGIRQQRASRGTRSFFLKYRDKLTGKLRLFTVGQYDAALKGVSIATARQLADKARGQIAAGIDPAGEWQAKKSAAREQKAAVAFDEATSLKKLVPLFIAQMKKRKRWGARTAKEVDRIFKVYVLPEWGGKPIGSIRRSMVAELIEKVEDNNGPVMADRLFAWVRAMFVWQSARDETFESPIVRGMAPIKNPSERARERSLTDAEIRSIWTACDKAKPWIFGQLVRELLLTAQRPREVAGMTRPEVADDLWVIPQSRYKTKMKNGHAVPLSAEALAILNGLPKFKSLYFSTDGKTAFSGFSKAKKELDRLSGVKGWQLRDLRRTAKTLMQRAGVRPDISERVLGHVIQGVEGVYDRHPYLAEKRKALEALAALLASILAAEAPEKAA